MVRACCVRKLGCSAGSGACLSTGTAMAALHGAAAANAWLGLGSAGARLQPVAEAWRWAHIILPGSWHGRRRNVLFGNSRREANRLSDICEEVEAANSINQRLLTTLKSNAGKIREWDRRLETEYEMLKKAVREARVNDSSFLSGLISRFTSGEHAGRGLGGEYYRPHEQYFVDRLDSAVIRFLDAFRNV